jgi:hypothetical protein
MLAILCRRFASIVVLATALGGCGSTPAYLHGPEHQLGVETTWYDSDLRIWHSALFKPRGEGLRSPGYVLGIEKVKPAATVPVSLNGVPLPATSGFYITHVIRYQETAATDKLPAMNTSCVLFTMIDRETHAAGSGAADVDSAQHVFDRCPNATATPSHISRETASQWTDLEPNALTTLHTDLTPALSSGRFTDIVVMMMGWNTDEQSALNNFSALTGHMIDEARRRHGDFRPLVIGVSWPSEWQLDDWSVIPDAVVRGLSFPFKAAQADELGAHVVSYLVKQVLQIREADAKALRVVLLGHSFGARAMVQAVKALDPATTAKFNDQDRMILFEGAFEIHTLFTDVADKYRDADGNLDEHFRNGRPRVTLTSSRYDTAVSAAVWGRYAGAADTFDDVCHENSKTWKPFLQHPLVVSQIGCEDLSNSGGNRQYGLQLCSVAKDGDHDYGQLSRPLHGAAPSERTKTWPVRYFDASAMINCNEPFTGGGAHSDIFRDETARFLLDEIAGE